MAGKKKEEAAPTAVEEVVEVKDAAEAPEAPAEPEPKTHFVTLKGKGLCKVWVNGTPSEIPRGTEILIPDNIYHILNDAGEIA